MMQFTKIMFVLLGLLSMALSLMHLYFAAMMYATGENFGTSTLLSAFFLLIGIRMLKMAKSGNKDSC